VFLKVGRFCENVWKVEVLGIGRVNQNAEECSDVSSNCGVLCQGLGILLEKFVFLKRWLNLGTLL